jgi:lambda family phage minor tail protein L
MTPIRSDIQKLDLGRMITLFVLDATSIGGGVSYWHPGTKSDYTAIIFQGNTYNPFPIEASGFEWVGGGQAPRPRVVVANVNQLVAAMNRDYQDLVGAKLTRKRTFAKYLDGEPGADPTAEFPLDIFYIERKVRENKVVVEYELASIYDMEGIYLPRRQIVGNICQFDYMGAECGWGGGPPYFKEDDTSTAVPGEDRCGKRKISCKLRFGTYNPIPFGGFPGAGRIT